MVIRSARMYSIPMGYENQNYCQQIRLFQISTLFGKFKIHRHRRTLEPDKLPGNVFNTTIVFSKSFLGIKMPLLIFLGCLRIYPDAITL